MMAHTLQHMWVKPREDGKPRFPKTENLKRSECKNGILYMLDSKEDSSRFKCVDDANTYVLKKRNESLRPKSAQSKLHTPYSFRPPIIQKPNALRTSLLSQVDETFETESQPDEVEPDNSITSSIAYIQKKYEQNLQVMTILFEEKSEMVERMRDLEKELTVLKHIQRIHRGHQRSASPYRGRSMNNCSTITSRGVSEPGRRSLNNENFEIREESDMSKVEKSIQEKTILVGES